jgi:hypothetical protein
MKTGVRKFVRECVYLAIGWSAQIGSPIAGIPAKPLLCPMKSQQRAARMRAFTR